MTDEQHLRGQLAALRWVRKWLHECWERNIDFEIKQTSAPKWMLLSAKYGALTQEGHIKGLDARISKLNKQLRRMTHE